LFFPGVPFCFVGVRAALWFWAFTAYKLGLYQKPKNNVPHAGWHKKHDRKNNRRAGVWSSLKCERPPELVILGYGEKSNQKQNIQTAYICMTILK